MTIAAPNARSRRIRRASACALAIALGLGLALLLESFRRFHGRGGRVVALGVDAENPTGAPRSTPSVPRSGGRSSPRPRWPDSRRP